MGLSIQGTFSRFSSFRDVTLDMAPFGLGSHLLSKSGAINCMTLRQMDQVSISGLA